jgi:hypothetical protein
MTRDRQIQLLFLSLAAAFLTLSGAVAVQLSASSGRNKLAYTDTAEAGDPPEVALGIAMGAFRGVFVNYLWIRANELKEEGKFYEAIDLSSAITKLQPRFPHVWVFHAWNMAYNISVGTQTAGERWQWVQAGIRLLRNEGIPANPNDLYLHKELAYIFLHKVQGITDDANQFYKRQIAKEWQIVLGEPPRPDPKDRSRTHAIAQYAQWLKAVAEAPETEQQLIEKFPEASALLKRLKEEVGDTGEFDLLRRYEMHRSLVTSGRRDMIRAQMGAKHQAFGKIFEEAGSAKALESIMLYYRKKLLRDEYNMDAYRMIRYTEKYGPIDWRHPAAHALYWSAKGVEEALTRYTDANKTDFDFINADRMTFQAVQELWRSGEIYFSFLDTMGRDDGYSFYLAAPNAYFIQSYRDILEEVIGRSWADVKTRVYGFYEAGYENFMKDAVRFLWRRGQKEEATKLKDDMGKWEGQNLNDAGRADYWAQPMEDFIQAELADRYTSPNVANAEIISSLMGAYATGLLGSDEELFRSQFEYAKSFHRYFMEQQKRDTVVGKAISRMEVMDQDFRIVAGAVFGEFIKFLDVDQAERVFSAAPADLQLFAYDVLADKFRVAMDESKEKGARKFGDVFPEPPGLKDHQAAMKRYFDERNNRVNDVIRR